MDALTGYCRDWRAWAGRCYQELMTDPLSTVYHAKSENFLENRSWTTAMKSHGSSKGEADWSEENGGRPHW